MLSFGFNTGDVNYTSRSGEIETRTSKPIKPQRCAGEVDDKWTPSPQRENLPAIPSFDTGPAPPIPPIEFRGSSLTEGETPVAQNVNHID
jgi:hypothetical protein